MKPETLRAELAGIYARATLPVAFDQAIVVRDPGLTLVYSPKAEYGTLIMSHSEIGAGTDEHGNGYLDGDTVYEAALVRASAPARRQGTDITDADVALRAYYAAGLGHPDKPAPASDT